jgi:chromatin remodeling complex protein RSC6
LTVFATFYYSFSLNWLELSLTVLASNDQGQANNKHSILKTQMDRISLYESTISNSAKICRPIIEGIERSIRQVILRFYIHHKFYPALDEGGSSFFLLNIEGHLLDGKLRKIGKAVKFSNFFDKIEVHVEKKATASLVYTWKRDKSGVEVDGIKIKVFAEKLTLCKIGLFRRNLLTLRNRFVRFRYCEISPKLRQLLPNLRTDPSEDEVLLAVWQYITDRDLFGDKDHKIIRCDELLKGILQTDSFLVSYLRGKLAPHILGEKPVLVEHYLDPLNTESFLNPPNESVTHQQL